ncbi:nuclear transport factor 2 family protein [Advenella sp. FME57]|uniref:nuclear transport factor 2 family protein n=1 Tax=Advenella sp. FME57 TaxID=2742604 RepID=UPI001D002945|nr:nuclear transport factor 2 family protein [Advenella sp. FME57]
MMPLNNRAVVNKLIAATNAFNIDTALALFSPEAVIHDVSVGKQFTGHAGISDYLKRYFVDYHTQTHLLSAEFKDQGQAQVRVDFTGEFGHEIGLLCFLFDTGWRIVRIDADLE